MKPDINFNEIKSSNIEKCGHCQKTNTLGVKFKGGGIYHYHDFNADKFNTMLKADSVGKFFHSSVKNSHKFTKI